MNRTSWAWCLAITGGVVLWCVTAAVSGKREAWDAPLYWMFAYPLSIGVAGMLAYWVPDKPWRWGLTVMWVQAVVLVLSGSDFNLLPLGLILFAVLALPAIGVAVVMAQLRLRKGKM